MRMNKGNGLSFHCFLLFKITLIKLFFEQDVITPAIHTLSHPISHRTYNTYFNINLGAAFDFENIHSASYVHNTHTP